MDASDGEWVRQIVSLPWWRWRRRHHRYLFVSGDSGHYVDQLHRGLRLLTDSCLLHLLLSRRLLTHTHIFHVHSPPQPPPCSFSMQFLSNGDRWLAASCCFFGLVQPPPPTFSAAPGLLQLMARLQRLQRNSNAAPISLSLSLCPSPSASWGVMRGERGEAVWDGGGG